MDPVETHLLVLAFASILPRTRLETIDIFVKDHGRRFDFLSPPMGFLNSGFRGFDQ